MNKHNCWEFMKCGREPGGEKSDESGVCPVSAEKSAHGLNGGVNGGRICWIIAENCCINNGRNTHMSQEDCCYQCEFRYRVTQDEGLLNVCKATGFLLSNSGKKGK